MNCIIDRATLGGWKGIYLWWICQFFSSCFYSCIFRRYIQKFLYSLILFYAHFDILHTTEVIRRYRNYWPGSKPSEFLKGSSMWVLHTFNGKIEKFAHNILRQTSSYRKLTPDFPQKGLFFWGGGSFFRFVSSIFIFFVIIFMRLTFIWG